VVDQCRGNLKAAAEALGIARSTLYAKVSEFGIE
jgi:transcriptional regulator of acetoin/glycerol metabolism